MIVSARDISLKDGQTLVLRSPLEADAAALLRMLARVGEESYRNMNHGPDHWNAFSVEKEAGILKAFAEASNRFTISAFDADGLIVGNIGIFGVEGSPFLVHNARVGMGLIRGYHGRGLGTQLLRAAMVEAKAAGFRRLELTVRTFNSGGIALYEKVGFRRVGLLKDVALIDGAYCDEYIYDMIL